MIRRFVVLHKSDVKWSARRALTSSRGAAAGRVSKDGELGSCIDPSRLAALAPQDDVVSVQMLVDDPKAPIKTSFGGDALGLLGGGAFDG